MKKFKEFFLEGRQKKNERKTSVKRKQLLKHPVEIRVLEGDKDKGTQSKILVHSLMDANMKGYVKFNSWEDAFETYQRLTNTDSIVEYLQRNSQRYASATDWSYIVREEVDTRENMKTKLPQQPDAPQEEEEVVEDRQYGENETVEDRQHGKEETVEDRQHGKEETVEGTQFKP